MFLSFHQNRFTKCSSIFYKTRFVLMKHLLTQLYQWKFQLIITLMSHTCYNLNYNNWSNLFKKSSKRFDTTDSIRMIHLYYLAYTINFSFNLSVVVNIDHVISLQNKNPNTRTFDVNKNIIHHMLPTALQFQDFSNFRCLFEMANTTRD